MAHDVFISYSNKDKPVADAACAALEASGIRCWIAPRDVLPGTDWGEAIIDALNGSHVMVLVYSANANDSPQIKREVERAVNHGTVVVPFRIEDVPMSKSLEYFISTPHWLDALTKPLEQHLGYLTDTVQALLDRHQGGSPAGPSIVARRPSVRSKAPRTPLATAGIITGILVLALVAILGIRALGPIATPPSVDAPPSPPAQPVNQDDEGPILLSSERESSGANAFPRVPTNPSAAAASFENGEYILRTINPGSTGSVVFPALRTNTSLAVDARLVGDPAGRAISFSCRSQGGGTSAYRVRFEPDRQRVAIVRWTQGTQATLAARESTNIHRGNETNRIEMRCVGNQIRVLVNGLAVISAQDDTFAEGRLEIAVFGEGVTAEARFTNMVLREVRAGSAPASN